MKIKTAELTDRALDWTVASIEKMPKDAVSVANGHPVVLRTYCGEVTELRCEFSTNWAQGGPIIERERIEFDFDEDNQVFRAYDGVHAGVGRTHLVAAMRCFVASRLGDEVDVPDELMV